MQKIGFCVDWIEKIMVCISSVYFSFKINGTQARDPISPYLFLLSADAFSTLLSKAAQVDSLGYYLQRGPGHMVSHLFLANNSILFSKASVEECSKVVDIISKYERASGKMVNLSKTEVMFSRGVSRERRQEIVNILGVKEVER